MMLLHGEQSLRILAPIPLSGTLVSTAQISEVLDKGKAAAVTSFTQTKNKATRKVIFENQRIVFIRGSGGFGGKKIGTGTFPNAFSLLSLNLEALTSLAFRSRKCYCT